MFNLDEQPYYDSKCPDCIDPDRLRKTCWECAEPIPLGEAEAVGLTNRRGRHAGRTDYVAMHEDCAARFRSRTSHRP